MCESCGTTFQTEERPRLWINRSGEDEPFLRGVLLASLRRARAGLDPPVSDKQLGEAVRRLVVQLLADGRDRTSTDEVRRRTGQILTDLGLEAVAFRYDPLLDPDSFSVIKRGNREPQPFNRRQLRESIEAASGKFLDSAAVTDAVQDVEAELAAGSGAVQTIEIRRLVGEALRRRDERAFLRYSLGGRSDVATLAQFLDRVAAPLQVSKRDGSVVVFESEKLSKSIRRSFVSERRNTRKEEIQQFVAAEEDRVREKMTDDGEPDSTAQIGTRVLDWLFDVDELAWANYWLAFMSDHEEIPNGSPTLQLARAHMEMRRRREAVA